MEGLAPVHQFVIFLRFALERGDSLRKALSSYLDNHQLQSSCRVKSKSQNLFAMDVLVWFRLREKGGSSAATPLLKQFKSPYQRAIVGILDRGLSGESILIQLQMMEKEIQDVCEHQIEVFIGMLPIRMLVPLLLFQFPAFLILLFGPLLIDLLQSL